MQILGYETVNGATKQKGFGDILEVCRLTQSEKKSWEQTSYSIIGK